MSAWLTFCIDGLAPVASNSIRSLHLHYSSDITVRCTVITEREMPSIRIWLHDVTAFGSIWLTGMATQLRAGPADGATGRSPGVCDARSTIEAGPVSWLPSLVISQP